MSDLIHSSPHFGRIARLLPVLTAFLLLFATAACHSSKKSFYADDIYDRNRPTHGHQSGRPAAGSAGEASVGVIRAAEQWLGVPYKFGGNSREGVDCSGLTVMAFETGAGIKLPRSSSEQAEWGRPVERDRVRPGDMVFFTNKRGSGRINHVAIYVGDNRIIHATTSRGVCYSNLDDPYWREHLSCFRRALPE